MPAKGVIDMYSHSMRLLRKSGIPSLHYVPDPELGCLNLHDGYQLHPLFQALPERARKSPDIEAPLASRPLDVCYFGAESEHREKIIARAAPVLAKFNCCIYHRRLRRGPLVGQDAALVSIAGHVSGMSKITLNLHRDRFGAFEWYRIVRIAMCAGSLVLSEQGLPVPGFVSGVHYMEIDARHMPELIEWLLTDPEGIEQAERVRSNAVELLRKNRVDNQAALRVMSFLMERP
jgi:hypothetical protein